MRTYDIINAGSKNRYMANERIVSNSGRSIQLQNLPQNHLSTLDEARELLKLGAFDMLETLYGNTPDTLSQLIRTMLVPKAGCEFVVADFSAIEARVLAWLAGEQWRLDSFNADADIYCASASQMFGVPVEKHGVNGHLRQKGKVAELACGYGGAAGALIAMGALDMGLKESELPDLISDWRNANPRIVQYWWDVDKAATDTVKIGNLNQVGLITFERYAGELFITLPSGRKLAYASPRLETNRFGRMGITYMSIGTNNKWQRLETYGPKIVENSVQATARDLLAEAMLRVRDAGYDIILHCHDEMCVEVPKGTLTVDALCKLMSVNPSWAEGLPLNADGYACPYYQKS